MEGSNWRQQVWPGVEASLPLLPSPVEHPDPYLEGPLPASLPGLSAALPVSPEALAPSPSPPRGTRSQAGWRLGRCGTAISHPLTTAPWGSESHPLLRDRNDTGTVGRADLDLFRAHKWVPRESSRSKGVRRLPILASPQGMKKAFRVCKRSRGQLLLRLTVPSNHHTCHQVPDLSSGLAQNQSAPSGT